MLNTRPINHTFGFSFEEPREIGKYERPSILQNYLADTSVDYDDMQAAWCPLSEGANKRLSNNHDISSVSFVIALWQTVPRPRRSPGECQPLRHYHIA